MWTLETKSFCLASVTHDELEFQHSSHDVTLEQPFSETKIKSRDREYDFLYSVERVSA